MAMRCFMRCILVLLLIAGTFLIAKGDVDDVVLLPFCRKGHVQETILLNNRDEHGVVVFGGNGLNYRSPNTLLGDLWSLTLSGDVLSAFDFRWFQVSPSSNERWPGRRTSSGHAVSSEGFLVIHGGESEEPSYTDGESLLLSDLWVRTTTGWKEIVQDEKSAATVPLARKGHALVVLPTSGTLILWGGQTDVDFKGSNSGRRATEEESAEAPSSGGEPQASIGTVSSNTCLSDVYLLDINSAITLQQQQQQQQQDQDLDNLSTTAAASWKPSVSFPESRGKGCLEGSSTTAILDPLDDNKEKMIVFGGRLVTQETSSNSKTTSVDRHLHYKYSNDLWLFDPTSSSDAKWTLLVQTSLPSQRPSPRDKHAASYVKEFETLFISGGRSIFSSSLTQSQTGNNNYIEDPYSQQGDDVSTTLMDVWGYNLRTRAWTLYSDTTTAAAIVPALASSPPLFPCARFQHTMSVYRGKKGIDNPLLVMFGGQHSLRTSSLGNALQQGEEEEENSSKKKGDRGWGKFGSNDDDSRNIHSQLNDVWIFQLNQLPPSSTASTTSGWKLVSRGGCLSGDDGRVTKKAGIDISALVVLCSIGLAVIIGIVAFQTIEKCRHGNYETLADETGIQMSTDDVPFDTKDEHVQRADA